MAITVNGRDGIDLTRIKIRLDRIGDHRQGISEILDDIGKLISQEARVMARQQDIINTARLINSIKHRISSGRNKITTTVAPVNVDYAKYQELGARRTPASRAAMFAKLREQGMIGLRPAKPGFSETQHIARPFMSPAFKRHAFKAIDMIRELFKEDV